jgi:hypothetical protein
MSKRVFELERAAEASQGAVRSRGSRPAGTGPPQNACPMPAALSRPCWARMAGSLEGVRGNES